MVSNLENIRKQALVDGETLTVNQVLLISYEVRKSELITSGRDLHRSVVIKRASEKHPS